MTLISLLIVLILVGVLLYVVESVLPLDPSIKVIIRAVVLIVVVLWIISLFFGDIPLPHLRR